MKIKHYIYFFFASFVLIFLMLLVSPTQDCLRDSVSTREHFEKNPRKVRLVLLDWDEMIPDSHERARIDSYWQTEFCYQVEPKVWVMVDSQLIYPNINVWDQLLVTINVNTIDLFSSYHGS